MLSDSASLLLSCCLLAASSCNCAVNVAALALVLSSSPTSRLEVSTHAVQQAQLCNTAHKTQADTDICKFNSARGHGSRGSQDQLMSPHAGRNGRHNRDSRQSSEVIPFRSPCAIFSAATSCWTLSASALCCPLLPLSSSLSFKSTQSWPALGWMFSEDLARM